MLVPYGMIQLWGKKEIEVCPGNRDLNSKYESNQFFHRKPDIILWSLRLFWVERFDLNKSLKIDSWRNTFLYRCKNSARNRLFPISRLGQMIHRKLKPRSSWHLLHVPFNLFYSFRKTCSSIYSKDVFQLVCDLDSIDWDVIFFSETRTPSN